MMITPDPFPEDIEKRFNGVGETKEGRKVFLVFTIRQMEDGTYIRPISARYMHEKEIKRYEQR